MFCVMLGVLVGVVGAQVATIGTGIQTEVPASEFEVFSYYVSSGSLGVLRHFWVTYSVPSDSMVVRYYADGEQNASIAFPLSSGLGQAFPSLQATSFPPQGVFAAGGKFGKGAVEGGWHFSAPIPFGSSIRVTIEPVQKTHVWIIVRGEERALSLGGVRLESGFVLPVAARLRIQTTNNATFAPLSFVPLAVLPPGKSGLLYKLSFAYTTPTAHPNAIEGCYHLYPTSSSPFPGIVLSTGVEDLYDSSYAFCTHNKDPSSACFIAAPTAGLMAFSIADGITQLSAYRYFDQEVVAFNDGGRLEWRVGDVVNKCADNSTTNPIGQPQPTAVDAYTWLYEW